MKLYYSTSGFTLIELMIVIVLAGIMLLTSVTSFNHLFMANKSTTNANRIASALEYARSQAITNNSKIKFCASKDSKECGGNWHDGQIILNARKKVIRIFSPLPAKDQLTWRSSLGKNKAIIFTPLGTTDGQQGSFTYCPNSKAKYARVIIISQTGHIRISDKTANGTKIICD